MRRSALWLALGITVSTAATLVRGARRWLASAEAPEEPEWDRSERRSGDDRRSGENRRSGDERRERRSPLVERIGAAGERRSGVERRSGRDRRSAGDRRRALAA